ncbi:hypothetical protein [Candidatus Nephthysia bennettiae]|uniref:Uncharacterized protein n=1 Tax=Candidatus Nephthysia bennettiae TaxID=3127016 RepID=A0A934K8V3_9BACT|nr:hypothetical protein [Candidatus Dormibacteraeota bacterium]MBJ7613939.1 hypothetical protein [Candidatus Dormibacteraeota bacterium]
MNGKALWPDAVRVAVLSIGLAVLLELLQVVFARVTGTPYAASEVVRDALLKVPWAIVVCVALWIAMRIAANRPAVIALIGLVAAPIGSLLARSSAEMAHGLAVAAEPAAAPSPLLVATFRGVEYACLGLAVMWLGRKVWSNGLHHAGAGFLVGLLFGGLLLALTAVLTSNPFITATVGAWIVNELLFPVGCALIVFVNAKPRMA